MSNDSTGEQDSARDRDPYHFDSVRLNFWPENGTRPFFLDVVTAPDRTIECFRIRREGERIFGGY